MNPEAKMREFLKAWKNKKWNKMVDSCQITWLFNNDNAKQLLQSQYGPFVLMQYKIKVDKIVMIGDNKVMAHVPVTITLKNLLGKVEQKYSVGVVVKEEKPYQTNVDGKWGVNPVSMLRRINVSSEIS